MFFTASDSPNTPNITEIDWKKSWASHYSHPPFSAKEAFFLLANELGNCLLLVMQGIFCHVSNLFGHSDFIKIVFLVLPWKYCWLLKVCFLQFHILHIYLYIFLWFWHFYRHFILFLPVFLYFLHKVTFVKFCVLYFCTA